MATIIDGINIETASLENLKELRNKYHPDKFGGKFPDEQTKQYYETIEDQIDSRENSSSNNELIKIQNELLIQQQTFMQDMLLYKSKGEIKIELRDELQQYIKQSKTKYTLPKVSISAITAITSAVFFAPETLASHPIVGPIITNNIDKVGVMWVICLITLLQIFAISYFYEKKELKTITLLQSPMWQRPMFAMFLNDLPRNVFTESEFFIFLMASMGNSLNTTHISPINFFKIPEELMLKVCQSILIEAEQNGKIEKIKSKELSATYSVNL